MKRKAETLFVGVLGTFGSGKTLLLVLLGRNNGEQYRVLLKQLGFEDEVPNKPLRVYANFHMKGAKYITPEDFLEIKREEGFENLVLLQEVYAWLDARMSMTKVNRFLKTIVLQVRKRAMNIVWDAQLLRTVELILKESTDILVECEKARAVDGGKVFVYHVNWQPNLRTMRSAVMFLTEENAMKFWDEYNTYEIEQPITEVITPEDLTRKLKVKGRKRKI